jgi:hypothetical protein
MIVDWVACWVAIGFGEELDGQEGRHNANMELAAVVLDCRGAGWKPPASAGVKS